MLEGSENGMLLLLATYLYLLQSGVHLLRLCVLSFLYNNQMNARALIGRSAMVYGASKLMEILCVF